MIAKVLERPYAALSNMVGYNEKDTKEAEVVSTNLGGETWDERLRELRYAADREKENPFLHIPIRLAPGETVSNEVFGEIAEKYMAKMNLDPDRFPYMAVRHYDVKDGEHIHLVVARTAQDNGEFWNESFYKRKSVKAITALMKEYNLKELEKKQETSPKLNATLNEINMFAHKDELSAKTTAFKAVATVLQEGGAKEKIPLRQFVERLEEQGVKVNFSTQNDGSKISGVSFAVQTPYRDYLFKGSAVAKQFSWNYLAKQVQFNSEQDKYFIMSTNLRCQEELNTPKGKNDKNSILAALEKHKASPALVELIKNTNISASMSKKVSALVAGWSKASPEMVMAQQGQLLKFVHNSAVKTAERRMQFYEKSKGVVLSKNEINQATGFVLKHNNSKEAIIWTTKYPIPLSSISLEKHLSAFEFQQINIPSALAEGRKEKEAFAQQFGIDGNLKARFMNTPLTATALAEMRNLAQNSDSSASKEAYTFASRKTLQYGVYYREKVCEVAAKNNIQDPAAAAKLYAIAEKNNLNPGYLSALHSAKLTHSAVSSPSFESEIMGKKGFNADFSGLGAVFNDLNNNPYDPMPGNSWETEEERKRRKRRGQTPQ